MRLLSRLLPPSRRLLVTHSADRATIYALSTPPGQAGVAVVRVSGPAARDVFAAMVFNSKTSTPLRPRHSHLTPCIVLDHRPTSRATIDQAMAVFFQGPKSFTAEDTVELHLHSSIPVVTRVLNCLSHIKGCRPALPGEFTQRAFEHGRIDLIQAEGLNDLINAQTEEQRALALHVTQGSNSTLLEGVRSRIVSCLASVEALIDFGEGEDLDRGVFDDARQQVRQLNSDIEQYLHDGRIGEIIRSGIRTTIFGPPNAGKSTLLNFFARREAAIVAPIPGTTRDVIEVSTDVAGMPVIFADTAGLRPTDDHVETLGIERAAKEVLKNDISLCLLSLPGVDPSGPSPFHIDPQVLSLIDAKTIIVCNKLDLAPALDLSLLRSRIQQNTGCNHIYFISLSKGIGLDEFVEGLTEIIRERFQTVGHGMPLITRQRHRTHLERALGYLTVFLDYGPSDAVLAAEELRYAAREIGLITGDIGIEEILDSIFRSFCIGK